FVSPNQYKNARKELPDTIRVIEMSNDDAWIRDYGPSFLVNDKGEMRGVDWGFNAWGGLLDGLYFPWDKDNQIAKKVCDIERLDY
ncbi:agmatine deiminase family protein, partial [Escherichia coli]|nr:agmatine deiminase family protein [Escherichia coli]